MLFDLPLERSAGCTSPRAINDAAPVLNTTLKPHKMAAQPGTVYLYETILKPSPVPPDRGGRGSVQGQITGRGGVGGLLSAPGGVRRSKRAGAVHRTDVTKCPVLLRGFPSITASPASLSLLLMPPHPVPVARLNQTLVSPSPSHAALLINFTRIPRRTANDLVPRASDVGRLLPRPPPDDL